MTRQLTHQTGTEFGAWLRQQRALDSRNAKLAVHNLDYVVYNYGSPGIANVLLLEEKRYNGVLEFSQAETFRVLDQSLSFSNGQTIQTSYGPRRMAYHGLYCIVFENTTPLDGRMWWNALGCPRTEINIPMLVDLLTFRLDPFTL